MSATACKVFVVLGLRDADPALYNSDHEDANELQYHYFEGVYGKQRQAREVYDAGPPREMTTFVIDPFLSVHDLKTFNPYTDTAVTPAVGGSMTVFVRVGPGGEFYGAFATRPAAGWPVEFLREGQKGGTVEEYVVNS